MLHVWCSDAELPAAAEVVCQAHQPDIAAEEAPLAASEENKAPEPPEASEASEATEAPEPPEAFKAPEAFEAPEAAEPTLPQTARSPNSGLTATFGKGPAAPSTIAPGASNTTCLTTTPGKALIALSGSRPEDSTTLHSSDSLDSTRSCSIALTGVLPGTSKATGGAQGAAAVCGQAEASVSHGQAGAGVSHGQAEAPAYVAKVRQGTAAAALTGSAGLAKSAADTCSAGDVDAIQVMCSKTCQAGTGPQPAPTAAAATPAATAAAAASAPLAQPLVSKVSAATGLTMTSATDPLAASEPAVLAARPAAGASAQASPTHAGTGTAQPPADASAQASPIHAGTGPAQPPAPAVAGLESNLQAETDPRGAASMQVVDPDALSKWTQLPQHRHRGRHTPEELSPEQPWQV